MRFLITVASYYPVVGGVQVVTQNVAEELVRQGHSVTVLVSEQNDNNRIHELNGVALEYIKLYTHKDRIVGNQNDYIEYIKKKCKDVDVLVCVSVHSALTDALLPFIQELPCKKVLYLHGIYEFAWSQKDKSSVSRILSKLYYNSRRRFYYAGLYKHARKFDLIVHLSDDDASMKYMKKHGIKQNIVIHNAAEQAFFEPPKGECNEKYFLQVANYAEHKNQEFSLRAFYKANCDYMKMIYIGSQKNAYYEYLLKLNTDLERKYGKKNIEFLYGLSREDTIEMFKHAKAIILSSRVEKFPMVLVEGLACGVPFISTDRGNVKSIIGGNVVYTVDEMAQTMSRFSMMDVVDKKVLTDYACENFSMVENCDKLVKSCETIGASL